MSRGIARFFARLSLLLCAGMIALLIRSRLAERALTWRQRFKDDVENLVQGAQAGQCERALRALRDMSGKAKMAIFYTPRDLEAAGGREMEGLDYCLSTSINGHSGPL